MLYAEERVDRATGEIVKVEKGDWITLNELATLYAVGPRRARTILRKMKFLGIVDVGKHERHRIQPWAVEAGLGRTNRTKFNALPFDVISPEGRAWIDERWSTTAEAVETALREPERKAKAALERFQEGRRNGEMTIQECVSWLSSFFGGLTHSQLAAVLDVSQPLVSRYVKIAEDQRRACKERKAAHLDDAPKVRIVGLLGEFSDQPSD